MDGDTFQQWKKQCLNKCDLSKKGSVDEDIAHIVSLINCRDRYFTTSSCSGRILLLDAVSDCPDVQKQNCSWLFVTHQKCQSEDLLGGLEKSVGDATFKFEPFVLHIQCKALEMLNFCVITTSCWFVSQHTAAINSGFRNSGITIGKKGKIIMAVRSTHCLEVPLGHRGHMLVTEQYINFLAEKLNKLKFYDCLQASLELEEGKCSFGDKVEEKEKPVYRRRRKHRREHVTDSSQCQSPDEHAENSDTDCRLLFSS
ncbi:hypothetical protein DNTS_007096 [Danionella cerebrum]|uniref:tRNA wybutosine-synthesizing protein 3 homolog n=1 Tax=Danionella cerebrum TaxID=2873325 RepID=A0A553QC98_9TELE|nr:hypothetical protein DNTS_007096 [Danionella translucida]